MIFSSMLRYCHLIPYCMFMSFVFQVVDGSTALDQRRRTMYDPDEIDEENRERLLKKRLNSAFKSFCNQVCIDVLILAWFCLTVCSIGYSGSRKERYDNRPRE